MCADADAAPVDLHLDRRVLFELGGRAAEGCRYEEHPKLAASQGVDGQTGPCQQAAKVVDTAVLAYGVEAPVEDAVAGFECGQEPLEGLGRRRLWGKVVGLSVTQLRPQTAQTRRVLSDEQLRREVEGVERPGEGPQLRLVELKAHHLADAELHPVKTHRPVVVQVREHEEQG